MAFTEKSDNTTLKNFGIFKKFLSCTADFESDILIYGYKSLVFWQCFICQCILTICWKAVKECFR